MTHAQIVCTMCGTSFDVAVNGACTSCPIHRGCHMVCCPACGHSFPDPSRSRLARWLSRLLAGTRVPLGTGFPPEGSAVVPCGLTLCDVKAGCRACVLRLEGIPPARREQLEAIGLRAGRSVRVLQHTPVTIVEVDQAEIALERDLARGISVTADLHSPANSSGGARAVS